MTKELITLSGATTSAAEAYRALRTNIIFSDGDDRLRVLLVCSASPEQNGDSRSHIIANLAVTLAQSGRTTLLVDCDLRRPMQHDIWGIPNEHGLSNVLVSGDELRIMDVGVEHLSVVTAGPRPDNPADLLGSTGMESLVTDFRQKAEFVLLDSAPVLPVTDAALLSVLTDGVLLVLNAGVSRRAHAEQARDMLDRVGARIVGAVLNNAPVDSSIKSY
jgi:non-specific protein-tyrosine kinase